MNEQLSKYQSLAGSLWAASRISHAIFKGSLGVMESGHCCSHLSVSEGNFIFLLQLKDRFLVYRVIVLGIFEW